jgi:hypothetical protein
VITTVYFQAAAYFPSVNPGLPQTLAPDIPIQADSDELA